MEDAAAMWAAVEQFHESGLSTTGALHAGAQERALVTEFLAIVPLEALFQALQLASDGGIPQQVKIVCSCIDRVLTNGGDNGQFFRPEMIPFILAGLRHDEAAARVLTVNQMIAHLKMRPSADQAIVLASPELLKELCDVMAEDDIEMATKGSTVLQELASVDGGDLYKVVLDALHSTIEDSDVSETSVVFMRYLDAVAAICEKRDDHMQYAISIHLIDLILKCLQSSDTLFVMTVLDLIPRLCRTRAGVTHIFESGALQTLLRMAQDPLLGDNALRLVGEISATAAKLRLQSWNWSDPMMSKAFLSTVEEKLQSADSLQQIAAMDAIAAFASTSEKELHLLLQHKHLCKLLLELGASTKMPLKANCLHALARILAAPTVLERPKDAVPVENAAVWSLNERLFVALGAECRRQSTMELLMDCLRQPFDELRIAIFTLLRAVAAQHSDWGVRALRAYGGFFEFLLDRTTEPTKEAREWKFAVVDALVASGGPPHEALDPVVLSRLREHLLKGPYVGKGATELELEAA